MHSTCHCFRTQPNALRCDYIKAYSVITTQCATKRNYWPLCSLSELGVPRHVFLTQVLSPRFVLGFTSSAGSHHQSCQRLTWVISSAKDFVALPDLMEVGMESHSMLNVADHKIQERVCESEAIIYPTASSLCRQGVLQLPFVSSTPN